MAAIRVTGLRKRFGDIAAVDGIDFSVEAGEIFGFIGPNGSGKSTTIRMLLGLLAPSGGCGQVLGYDISKESEAIRQRTGYMAQRFSLYEDLTVRENVAFCAGVYGLSGSRARERVHRALETVDLLGASDVRASALSTGWRQRLGLAAALVHEPSVMFLDEPTGGVDPLARRRFWDLLYVLAASGVTIMVTTHYMDEANHCHRLCLLNEGRVLLSGAPRSIKEAAGTADLGEIFSRIARREREEA